MPERLTPLVTGQYYHIFNRGVAKLPTFDVKRDYQRFLWTMQYYKYKRTQMRYSLFIRQAVEERANIINRLKIVGESNVSIICYCLMPNHFHLLLRQENDLGISTFMRKLQDSFTKYTNIKKDRVGPLFQGAFKSVLIDSDELLLHISRYIHINPTASHLVPEAELINFPYSSLAQYMGQKGEIEVETSPILKNFKSVDDYKQFVFDQVKYAQSLELLKHFDLESEKKAKIPDVRLFY